MLNYNTTPNTIVQGFGENKSFQAWNIVQEVDKFAYFVRRNFRLAINRQAQRNKLTAQAPQQTIGLEIRINSAYRVFPQNSVEKEAKKLRTISTSVAPREMAERFLTRFSIPCFFRVPDQQGRGQEKQQGGYAQDSSQCSFWFRDKSQSGAYNKHTTPDGIQ